MIDRVRLYAACGVCVLTAFVGWVAIGGGAGDAEPSDLLSLAETDPLSSPNTQSLVVRLAATGMFPDAEAALEPSEEIDPSSPQGVRRAILAVVEEGGDWRIYARALEGGLQTYRVGEMLADEWRIEEIRATTVRLSRAGESRTIEVLVDNEVAG